jgi:hypothetical protein
MVKVLTEQREASKDQVESGGRNGAEVARLVGLLFTVTIASS